MKWILYACILMINILGCTQVSEYEKDLKTLFDKEKEIMCKLQIMRDKATMEWDKVNNLIEKNLPDSMPQEERINMLKVKNADLIRMFESFDGLSDQIKQALNEVEHYDKKIAEKITEMKKDKQHIEDKKMMLFEKLNREQGPKAYEKMKEVYIETLTQECK